MSRDIYYRQGVIFFFESEQISKTKQIVLEEYKKEGQPFIHVTSTFESSDHRSDSKHYVNNALDYQRIYGRNYTIDVEKEKRVTVRIRERIRKKLEPIYGNYDIVLHLKSHIHIEYDPK